MNKFNDDLLDILVCPGTRTRLRYDLEKNMLASDAAQVFYPIQSSVPILILAEAIPFDDNNE